MFSFFSRLKQPASILVDPGCANTVFKIDDRIKIIPSFVVNHRRTNSVIAAGKEAFLMLGKLPSKFEIIKPIQHGKITNDRAYASLLEYGLSSFASDFNFQIQLARMYNRFLISLSPHVSYVD